MSLKLAFVEVNISVVNDFVKENIQVFKGHQIGKYFFEREIFVPICSHFTLGSTNRKSASSKLSPDVVGISEP